MCAACCTALCVMSCTAMRFVSCAVLHYVCCAALHGTSLHTPWHYTVLALRHRNVHNVLYGTVCVQCRTARVSCVALHCKCCAAPHCVRGAVEHCAVCAAVRCTVLRVLRCTALCCALHCTMRVVLYGTVCVVPHRTCVLCRREQCVLCCAQAHCAAHCSARSEVFFAALCAPSCTAWHGTARYLVVRGAGGAALQCAWCVNGHVCCAALHCVCVVMSCAALCAQRCTALCVFPGYTLEYPISF